MEESLYDSHAMRQFAQLSLTHGNLPDETTVFNFRRLLERHQLAARIFAEVNGLLSEKGLLLKDGTIVDATIISAPGSTKNASGKRDPEMHQTKKGQQLVLWHEGAYWCGCGLGSGHTVTTTSANAYDITQTHALLHGEEQGVFGDAGYAGVEKRDLLKVPDVQWNVAMKQSQKNAIQDKRLRKIVDRLVF